MSTLATPGERMELTQLAELRHEVSNALTPGLCYADMLLPHHPVWADEFDRAALEAIRVSLSRAEALLRPGPASPGRPGPIITDETSPAEDLRDLVDIALCQVPPERRRDVRAVDLATGPLTGSWNPWHVLQVLTNLLSNAAKYSAPGTAIRVTVARAGDYARVTVLDRGIGIRLADREAIFSGLRTAAARRIAPGNGIGLRLSRRLAEACGGRLSVTGVPRRGSALSLFLPLGSAASGTAGRAAA